MFDLTHAWIIVLPSFCLETLFFFPCAFLFYWQFPCRHLDQFFGCAGNDFEAILAEMEKDISMADIMMELGYGCTVNASHCKEMLSLFFPLDDVTLSRILGTIARTHTGLEDSQNTYSTFCSALGSSSVADSSWLSSWNVDVLVDSIKQLVSIVFTVDLPLYCGIAFSCFLDCYLLYQLVVKEAIASVCF